MKHVAWIDSAICRLRLLFNEPESVKLFRSFIKGTVTVGGMQMRRDIGSRGNSDTIGESERLASSPDHYHYKHENT